MSDRFRDENGRLTEYSFLCGYIEQRSTDHTRFRDGDLYTELWMESEHYHVRQIDRRPGATVFRPIWETFDNLAEALELFNKQPGEIFQKTS